ncbi:uncharacterized protein LOC125500950 isoform X3 [Athalia rosae]|uniref:uncharacterized protein LOC125500950 isoform X3 n=1 Tax=Athalia rosae TaxID=37344 RepID=UPI0020340E82|nr:uncharacterized protein LOC125500950 isoform X3 [Athalia rosae]
MNEATNLFCKVVYYVPEATAAKELFRHSMGTIFTKKINPDEGPAEAAATTAAEVAAPTAAGSSCDAAGSSCEAAAAGPQVDEVAAPSPDYYKGWNHVNQGALFD